MFQKGSATHLLKFLDDKEAANGLDLLEKLCWTDLNCQFLVPFEI